MSVRVAERLGWRRRGVPSAIRADPGRMTPVDAQRDCDARGGAGLQTVRCDSRQLKICPVVASCLNGILLPN